MEALVGHHAGACEIVCEFDREQAARLSLQARAVCDAVEQLVPTEQPQLMGELEDAFLRRQRVGEQHAPAVAVVAPDQVVHDVRRHEADLEAVGVREHGAQPLVEAVGIEALVGPELLGSFLQLGEVTGPGLDDVLHLVALDGGGRSREGRRGCRAATPGGAEPLRLVHRVFQEVAVGAEEEDDGIAERGARLGRVANVLIADTASGKQRVAEHLPQLGGDTPLVVFREALEIDVERLAELEQEGNRHGPLAALDQVQVARGDAELRRHARLGEPALAPEPAHSLARHHLALHRPPLAPMPDAPGARST